MSLLVNGYSIEATPRSASKVERFAEFLPAGTRVYIAHIEGVSIADMVAVARRLRDEGFPAMPHIPARMIRDGATLEDWIKRYRNDGGVEEALLIAGGLSRPHGAFDSSMQLLETGLFAKHGFRRLHVAGHPEGNRDIDRDGSTKNVDAALLWKQAYAKSTNVAMAIVTQFFFDADPIVRWAERLRALGVMLPIHAGIAGPTKLHTLLKYAVSCGVGASLKVIQKHAMDVPRLMTPYSPLEVLAQLAAHRQADPSGAIERIHIFPFGGIKASAEWVNAHASQASSTARLA